ncbi:hypothetical protein SJ402_28110, partial [Klebsiella variicola]|uniref:hypothetical protein n=1 Tax=Klebsiella variicola TaxID=244366 RepID=UPI0029D44BEE
KRAYCLKTQPATGETYPKSDLFNKATMSNKDCKTPLDLMIKSFKSGLIPIEKMPLSKTERLIPLNINTAGKIFTHATWPRCRYIFVPDEAGIMKLVNVVKLRLKPLEEK